MIRVREFNGTQWVAYSTEGGASEGVGRTREEAVCALHTELLETQKRIAVRLAALTEELDACRKEFLAR